MHSCTHLGGFFTQVVLYHFIMVEYICTIIKSSPIYQVKNTYLTVQLCIIYHTYLYLIIYILIHYHYPCLSLSLSSLFYLSLPPFSNTVGSFWYYHCPTPHVIFALHCRSIHKQQFVRKFSILYQYIQCFKAPSMTPSPNLHYC